MAMKLFILDNKLIYLNNDHNMNLGRFSFLQIKKKIYINSIMYIDVIQKIHYKGNLHKLYKLCKNEILE